MNKAMTCLVGAALAVVTASCAGDDGASGPPTCVSEKLEEPDAFPGQLPLGAVLGFSYEEIYVVGKGLYRYGVSSGWQEILAPEEATFGGLWGLSPSEIFLVGTAGISRYDGVAVEPMEHPQLDQVTAIWGTASDNVWAAGEGQIDWLQHHLVHYDGQAWTVDQSFDSDSGCRVYDIWGFSEDDIWAVGGCLLHWDGSEWASLGPEVEFGVASGIWGAEPDDVWFVG